MALGCCHNSCFLVGIKFLTSPVYVPLLRSTRSLRPPPLKPPGTCSRVLVLISNNQLFILRVWSFTVGGGSRGCLAPTGKPDPRCECVKPAGNLLQAALQCSLPLAHKRSWGLINVWPSCGRSVGKDRGVDVGTNLNSTDISEVSNVGSQPASTMGAHE